MTKRSDETSEFRWKITMTPGGQYAYGAGWLELLWYIQDCYRRGVCFKVHLKEMAEFTAANEYLGWKNAEDGIMRTREASRNRAEGLADVVLDEQCPKEELTTDSDHV